MNKRIYDTQPSICNCMNLRRASQAITGIYDDFLKPSGLSLSQFSILKHMKGLGVVSVSELAIKMRLDRTTLVRNLKFIEERGFITDISLKGTRNRQLDLTDRGHEVLERGEVLWAEAQCSLEQHLGKDNLNTLTRLLSKVEAFRP